MMLHGCCRSAESWCVGATLNLKGVTPEHVFPHLHRGKQRAAGYLALNPQRLGPLVDPRPRVCGLDGLQSAPASVRPDLVGDSMKAVLMMIAGKGADVVRGRASLPATDSALPIPSAVPELAHVPE